MWKELLWLYMYPLPYGLWDMGHRCALLCPWDSGQLMFSFSCCLFSTQQGWPVWASSCDPWLHYKIWSKDPTQWTWLCCLLNSMAIYLNMILCRRTPSKKRHNRQFIISMRGIWSYYLVKALGETRIMLVEELKCDMIISPTLYAQC